MSQNILFVGSSNLDGSGRRHLEQRGFALSSAKDFKRALQLLADAPAQLVVIDLDETEDGVGFIKRVRSMPKLTTTSVLVVGKWGSGQPTVALSHGADGYEPTPVDPIRLAETVERLLHKRAAAVGAND